MEKCHVLLYCFINIVLVLKNVVFWDMTPFDSYNQRLLGGKLRINTSQCATAANYGQGSKFAVSSHPDDGDDTFLRNFDS
jgi:hypothetical protein